VDQADAIAAPAGNGEDLLRAATVALATARGGQATGFFVTPNIIATCAHALSDTRESLPKAVSVRLAGGTADIEIPTSQSWYLRGDGSGPDLAFLPVPADSEAAGQQHVLLSPAVAIGDELRVWGHPAGMFRAGQSALFTHQGPSTIRAGDRDADLQRVFGTPVGGGFSGSPVLNPRTGAVIGMLCTSDNAGSAHLLSVDTIIAANPEVARVQSDAAANLDWLTTLDDAQIQAGGWVFPGPRLRAYLAAARDAADAHPYPGIVPGARRLPLTAVYLRQQASLPSEAATQPEEMVSAESLARRLPAETILDRAEDSVVIADPGAGKSCLLRMGLITLAERWLAGRSAPVVPVRVLASDLVAPLPLPEAIAAGVGAELSAAGHLRRLPSEFFGTAPLPGTRWLVLVDGLDEVMDPAHRRAVVKKIARLADDPLSLYRFVVTTRPLPEGELSEDWLPIRFHLEQFTAEQLPTYAEGWFDALELPSARSTAEQFVAEVSRVGLERLAGTPLVAAILCQLYAADPSKPLPAGRPGVYAEFVELLRSRQYTDASSGVFTQAQTMFGRYGPGAIDAARTVLAEAPDLIGRLADTWRLQGQDRRSALDLLADWTGHHRQQHVPVANWRHFLRELLRRSGLLTERADDFTFIHQTIAEYMAVRYVTADPQRSQSAFDELFGAWKRGLRSALRRTWREPDSWSRSHMSFLIAAWQDDRSRSEAVSRELYRLARYGRLPGSSVIANLVTEGIAVPDDVLEAARDTLAHEAGNRELTADERRDAAVDLSWLDDPRGLDLLAALAADRKLAWIERLMVARDLDEAEDPRGIDLLADLAVDPKLQWGQQLVVARHLDELGDPRGRGLLVTMATDQHRNLFQRQYAAVDLAELGDPRGLDLLVSLAADRSLDFAERTFAAVHLDELGDSRGRELLLNLVEDRTLDWFGQLALAAEFDSDGDPHARDLLLDLATDRIMDGAERLVVAAGSAGLGDPRSHEILADLATYWNLSWIDRTCVALALAGRGDRRGGEVLASLTVDPELTPSQQRVVARLAGFDHPRDQEAPANPAADQD
jgi:hypothetical protein